MNIQKASAEFGPVAVRDKACRILKRIPDGEMFFQRNLALHWHLPMTRFQFEHACECWLKHWKAYEVYGPEVEANTIDLMSGAVEKVYATLTNAGIDML